MALNHIVIHLDPTDPKANSVTLDGVSLHCNYVKVEAEAGRKMQVTINLLAVVDLEVGGVREYTFADDDGEGGE